MTIDSNRVYWTLQHTTRDYTSQITITHRLVLSVTVFIVLPCTSSKSGRFSTPGRKSSRAGGYLTPTAYFSNYRLKNSVVLSAGPPYTAWERTAQKTLLPTVTPLLLVTYPLPSNDSFSGTTVLSLREYNTICYTVQHVLFDQQNILPHAVECLCSSLSLRIIHLDHQ
jgi:hypothetical protein